MATLKPLAIPIMTGGVAIVAFLVYLATLTPTVFWGDSAELTTSAFFLGIPHPTGYPLYSLLGKAFISAVPLGDVGYRMNLLSAVFGALTIGVLFLALYSITRNILIAAAVALVFAFSYRFWRLSIVAEVYTLHTLLMASFLLFCIQWLITAQRKYLYLACLIFGISLAHHGMTILLFPALVFCMAVFMRNTRQLRLLPIFALLMLAGLPLYAYLPIRHSQAAVFDIAALIDADLTQPASLLHYIGGSIFRDQITALSIQRVYSQLGGVLAAVVADYLIIGALLAYLGAAMHYKSNPKLFLFCLTIIIPNLAFLSAYPVPDIEDFAVVATLSTAPWLALGVATVVSKLSHLAGRWPQTFDSWSKTAKLHPGLLLFALPIPVLISNYGYLDYSKNYSAAVYAREVLASLPPNAVLLFQFPAAPLWYGQLVEGRRPDVTLVDRTFGYLKERAILRDLPREEVIHKVNQELLDRYAERPKFVISYDPSIAGGWQFEDFGLVYKLSRKDAPRSRGYQTDILVKASSLIIASPWMGLA